MKYIFCALVFLYSCGSTAQMKKTTDDKLKVETDTIKDSTKITNKNSLENSEQEDKSEAEQSKQKANEIPFEISKATVQKFAGGAPGSNTTFMYQIVLTKLTSQPLSFKNLWMNDESLSVDLSLKRKFKADEWANYKKDDDIILYATKMKYGDAVKENVKLHSKKELGKKAPHKFSGAALLEYVLDGQSFYFELDTVEKLPAFVSP